MVLPLGRHRCFSCRLSFGLPTGSGSNLSQRLRYANTRPLCFSNIVPIGNFASCRWLSPRATCQGGQQMANRDLVAIGASAGGVEALVLLCTKLPAQFPAAILVTQHLPSHSNSVLDQLLSRAGPLPAKFADHGDPLRRGQIFLAPPARHLIA